MAGGDNFDEIFTKCVASIGTMAQVETLCVRDCSDILLWRSAQKIQRKARRLRNAKKKCCLSKAFNLVWFI